MDDSADSKAHGGTQRTRAEWRSIIARYEASSLGGNAFCAAEGVGKTAFWRRRRRFADEDAARAGNGGPAFVELSGAGAAAWDAELDLGAGGVLRVRRPRC